MPDELPSLTPKNSGDQHSATDKAGYENGSQCQEAVSVNSGHGGKGGSLSWTEFFECGGTGLVCWIWAEMIHCNDLKELCFYASAVTIFQAGSCDFVYTLLKKRTWAFWFSLLGWVMLTVLAWRVVLVNSRPTDSGLPQITPARLQLASDSTIVRKSVTIFNPNDFPVFNVSFDVEIEQTNIAASSIMIVPDQPPTSEINFGDIPGDFVRVDVINRSLSHPTNKYADSIILKFGVIPAKQRREFRISGSIKTNTWVHFSAPRYETNLTLLNWNSNFTQVAFPSVSGEGEWEFTPTNFPIWTILMTNGVPAWTNLPHLMLSLDWSGFGERLNMINDSLSLTNIPPKLFEITGLLVVPTKQAERKPMLNFWLMNDSALTISNIDLVFNSSRSFEWESNGVWRSVSSPPGEPTLTMMYPDSVWPIHVDSMTPGFGWRIPPMRFLYPDASIMMVSLSAKDTPQHVIGFWLWFGPTNIPSPYISKIAGLTVTNNDFQISIPVELKPNSVLR